MSLKKKESQATGGGLRVAAEEPHLVSLGGGRLSTAVTIHHLPIGDLTIGSSPSCGVVLNGSGVLPVHCTLYRNEAGDVILVPEPEGRTLIDGNRVMDEINLTQGAMLTIGKSNYLRFNNPAEAELIKSTIGSNERISMPQIDFTQDSSSQEGTPEEVFKNLNQFIESQYTHHTKANNEKCNEILDRFTKTEYSNMKNFHSPKVFAADSITMNAPAKDVLGSKYNNFAKNLTQNVVNYSSNSTNDKSNSAKMNSEPNGGVHKNNYVNLPNSPNAQNLYESSSNSSSSSPPANILTTFNNLGHFNVKPQNPASYDRYPKPGSYGSLQIFPMNGVNAQINNETDDLEAQRQKAQVDRLREQEMSRVEQERLEEILKLCADYERQNQSIQSSPIVQNRIKTNGSLPRDKKSPFGDLNSPFSEKNSPRGSHQNVFFPNNDSDKSRTRKANSGYENVTFNAEHKRVEISSRYENIDQSNNDLPNSKSGYENVFVTKKSGYIPQSPRTKIRTCVSPKKTVEIERKNEYDILVQTFEEKLKMEIQLIRENKTYDANVNCSPKSRHDDVALSAVGSTKDNNNGIGFSNAEIKLLSNLKYVGKSKEEVKAHHGENENMEHLKQERNQVLTKVRELKTQIAELQRQEDEVLRELDMEKALVAAELTTENKTLKEMEQDLNSLQLKIYRLEAQRNANRVMQETQQTKLKQNIEMKQEQVNGLEKLVETNDNDEDLKEDLNETIESLENDKKLFEDLEFQYLEEETDWLAYREELHNDLKGLTKTIDEKKSHILRLEKQKVENHNIACTDTKLLEKNLLTLLTDLEKRREELKSIDKRIFSISGQPQAQSDSDDETDMMKTRRKKDQIMSQSLFGSEEILNLRHSSNDMMSKSVNENMFFNNLEMPSNSTFSSTPKKNVTKIDVSQDITNIIKNDHEKLKQAEELDSKENSDEYESKASDSSKSTPSSLFQRQTDIETDPLLKLKYNLSPPFEHENSTDSRVNFNLSLEGDDFEVNPLDKRVPSQDDIDRISKVTSDAPISTLGASYKVKESIKEIERNRQLLLAQQGSLVIEHERQKMNELKKKSHDEARAQYLRLQSNRSDSDGFGCKDGNIEDVADKGPRDEAVQLNSKPTVQRHSHPDMDSQQQYRPLSEVNSDMSYEKNMLSDKPYKSTNDIRSSPNRTADNSDFEDSKRNSVVSQSEMSDAGTNGRLVSGNKRNLPKHQRPLTRYLPIMSHDLDLRQHIETAGHQLNLCPHVIVDSYSCRGYLHKLGATFHGWSRRWFVLDRQKEALIYYSDKSERKIRGGSYFTTIDEVYLDHMNTSKSGRIHCTFIVKTKKRSYHLQAASDAAARIWIDAIITGAQGNVDY